jgi:cysteine desulfurase
MAEALRLATKDQAIISEEMVRLRDRFESSLHRFCGAEVNGTGLRVCNTSNLFFPGVDGESLLMQLDLKGVAASHGSACSSGALEPSKVLLSMGYSQERALQSLRFSLSRYTTEEEIDRAVAIITEVVQVLSAMCGDRDGFGASERSFAHSEA